MFFCTTLGIAQNPQTVISCENVNNTSASPRFRGGMAMPRPEMLARCQSVPCSIADHRRDGSLLRLAASFVRLRTLSESKRIEKLRYMAGWPTCPRVAFLTRRNPERLHHKNSGRLAAALYFLIAHR